MFTILSDLLELFLVLGSSKWVWLGLVVGALASYLVWSLIALSPEKEVLSALSFFAVWAAIASIELKGPRP